MDVKSRHHLRDDAISEIEEALADQLDVRLDADTYEKVVFEDSDWEVVLVDGDPLVLYVDSEARGASSRSGEAAEGKPFLTVQGLNAHPPGRGIVTVDAGAVSFVSDGADVMRPGITEAEESIAEGDLVAINEESHGKFLAVGRAMTDGDDMIGESGKVVKSIHHVGDELFGFTA
jgi:PUA domain protein